MAEDARIDDLLEEILGGQRTSEDVCRHCPELLPVVRQRLGQLHAVRAQLENLFPTPNPTTVPGKELAVPAAQGPPQFPGHEIQGELGRGGMGVVYRAFDRERGREVALKTLQGMDPSALYRFKQEFRALAGVSHPNLVALYELVSDGRQWFFTMEYVEGVDFLRHVRGGGGAVDAGRLSAALRQLTEGLSALHAAGKLHRDVKPSNVLVEPSGRMVLLDFGLVAELDPAGQHLSTERQLLGTVAYMAPEQAAGMPVSPAADWYGVGVMLYEALAGRLPFAGAVFQVLRDKQERDPPSPHELAPGIPDDLERLCMELLRRDPTTRPTGPEVLGRLGAAPPNPAPATRPRPLFVGREAHLLALAEAFEAARRGRTVVVSVHGPSGAGKTALVQHFLDGLAEGSGAVVLAGRCYEQELVPYKALDSLIDALSRHLARLSLADAQAVLPRDVRPLARVFPVLRRLEAVARAPMGPGESADPHEARRRAAAALRELLARLGDRRPLVLFIDDLQWGDVDGAAFLADLLRPPDPPVLLLVGAYRSEDAAVSPFLRAYLGPGGAAATAPDRREVEAAPLAPAEARDLALTLLGRGDAADRVRAEAVARESGGSPFFVYELVQHLVGADGLSGDAALDQVLWARISRLPAEARGLLQMTVVAGRPLRLGDACRAAGIAETDAALAPLRSGRLLRAQQERIDAYHDRVRETVLAHLGPGDLADCHRRLAVALEEGGETDPEILAVHFHGAGQAVQAARCYAAAADQAADALAFDHAARLYRLALQLGRPAGLDERSLRVRLGDALANAGRGAEAASEYILAAGNAVGNASLELRRRAAMQLLVSGRQDEGLDVLRTVIAAVGLKLPSSPGQALLSLLFHRAWLWFRGLGFQERAANQIPEKDLIRTDVCWSAAVGLSMTDNVVGLDFNARHLLLSLAAGEPSRIALSLAMECGLSSVAGARTRRRGKVIAQRATVLAEGVGNQYVLALIALFGGAARAWCEGAWQEAHEKAEHAESILREHCTGVAWERATAHVFSLAALGWRGEWKMHGQRLPALMQEAWERGDLYAITTLPLLTYAYVLDLAADQPGRARERIHEAMKHWSCKGFHLQHYWALYGEVETDLYCGNPVGAWSAVSRNWAAIAASFLLRVQTIRLFSWSLRARCAVAATASMNPETRKLGSGRQLLRAAAADAHRMARERASWSPPLARMIQAAIAFQRGEHATAVLRCAEAEAGFMAASMSLFAAAARRRYGQLIGGDRGKSLVADAESWMAGQGICNPSRMTAVFAPGFPD